MSVSHVGPFTQAIVRGKQNLTARWLPDHVRPPAWFGGVMLLMLGSIACLAETPVDCRRLPQVDAPQPLPSVVIASAKPEFNASAAPADASEDAEPAEPARGKPPIDSEANASPVPSRLGAATPNVAAVELALPFPRRPTALPAIQTPAPSPRSAPTRLPATAELTGLATPHARFVLTEPIVPRGVPTRLGQSHLSDRSDEFPASVAVSNPVSEWVDPVAPVIHDMAVNEAVFPILRGIEQSMLRYPASESWELHDVILTTLQNAPEISILRADVGIADAEVERQDAAFDWNVFVSSNWDDRNTPVGSSLDGAQDRLLNRGLNNTMGLRQNNQYGGAINIGQDGNFADSNSQFFVPADQAIAQLGLTYEQPLLNGGGRQVARSRFDIAVLQTAVSREDFLQGLQRHILDTINAYWQLAASRAVCSIQQRNLKLAEEVTELVKNRTDLDVGPAQLARAEATLAARQTEVLRSEYAVLLDQERLMRLMLGPAFETQAARELVPRTNLFAPSSTAPLELQHQIAIQNRPEIRRSLQTIKQASIEQGVAENQLLPVLGLTLSLSNRGLAGDRQLFSAVGDQFDLPNTTYGFGLAYELPIGNRAARASLSQAKLRIARLQSQLETTVADVSLEVRNAAHVLTLATQELELSIRENSLAKRELEIIEKRYELLIDGDAVGALYLDNLLLTQERLVATETRLVQAALRCKQSEFELQRATGVLLRETRDSVGPPTF